MVVGDVFVISIDGRLDAGNGQRSRCVSLHAPIKSWIENVDVLLLLFEAEVLVLVLEVKETEKLAYESPYPNGRTESL